MRGDCPLICRAHARMNTLIDTDTIARTLTGRLADLHGADNVAGHLEHLARCLRRSPHPPVTSGPSPRRARLALRAEPARGRTTRSEFDCRDGLRGAPGQPADRISAMNAVIETDTTVHTLVDRRVEPRDAVSRST
jgi:hypothetical protein